MCPNKYSIEWDETKTNYNYNKFNGRGQAI